MAKTATGKGATDIFAPTTSASDAQRPQAGRPPMHEPWSKVTVVLLDRQVVFLDRLAASIRAATGSVVKRAGILRALVDALQESELDLTKARSETALKTLVLQRLKDKGHPPG